MAAAKIVEVWAHNFREEIKRVIHIVDDYPVVAMDTEFPGVLLRPVTREDDHYYYKLIHMNVNQMQLIQVGLSFYNEQGQRYEPVLAWQFNLKFDKNAELYAQDSIHMLEHEAGLDFKQLAENGIDRLDFGEALITSGLVLRPEVTWVVFDGAYDFGYLLKVVTNQSIPEDEHRFFELLEQYFPNIFDLKSLMTCVSVPPGGLNKLATQLEVQRMGTAHTAGSDCLLTGDLFFRMRERYFDGIVSPAKFNRLLPRLGGPSPGAAAATAVNGYVSHKS